MGCTIALKSMTKRTFGDWRLTGLRTILEEFGDEVSRAWALALLTRKLFLETSGSLSAK